MTDSTLPNDPYVAAFPELRTFWEATARGVLLLPTCRACSRAHWHPRAQCPECHASDIAWKEATGLGRVHTFTVVRRPSGDTLLAYVRVDEGPLLLTNLVDIDAAAVSIGLRVEVAFRAAPEGRIAPIFKPYAPGASHPSVIVK